MDSAIICNSIKWRVGSCNGRRTLCSNCDFLCKNVKSSITIGYDSINCPNDDATCLLVLFIRYKSVYDLPTISNTNIISISSSSISINIKTTTTTVVYCNAYDHTNTISSSNGNITSSSNNETVVVLSRLQPKVMYRVVCSIKDSLGQYTSSVVVSSSVVTSCCKLITVSVATTTITTTSSTTTSSILRSFLKISFDRYPEQVLVRALLVDSTSSSSTISRLIDSTSSGSSSSSRFIPSTLYAGDGPIKEVNYYLDLNTSSITTGTYNISILVYSSSNDILEGPDVDDYDRMYTIKYTNSISSVVVRSSSSSRLPPRFLSAVFSSDGSVVIMTTDVAVDTTSTATGYHHHHHHHH